MAGGTVRFLMLVFSALYVDSAAWAGTPPPPVNQYLGIPDTTFNEMTTDICLGCHGSPAEAVAPVRAGYLPDRHHLRLGTPIGEFSASPFPEKSADGKHNCLTCHLLEWVSDASEPNGGVFRYANNRDCMSCHIQKVNQRGELIATVHHLTDWAQNANCHYCHGSLIDDPNGDHRIPDPARYPDDKENHYDISLTTPWPGSGFYESRVQLRRALEASFSYKLDIPHAPTDEQARGKESALAQINYIMDNFDPPIGETGRPMGNCAYCHFSGIDDVGGRVIDVNYATHHGTGVGQPGSGSVHSCDLCHRPHAPPGFTIRGCERCHGMGSLHRIEYDADGDGIVVGGEAPYFGHIGNQKNCDGCHRNSPQETILISDDVPFSGTAIVPDIQKTSDTGMVAGTDSRLFLSGSGFTSKAATLNSAVEESLSTTLRLVNMNGKTVELLPDFLSDTYLEVTLPADLPVGSYRLAVARQGALSDKILVSRPISFLVKPKVAIQSVDCKDGIVTVSGSGFGNYLDSGGSGTAVTSGDGMAVCTVDSWTDDRITAHCSSGVGDSIRVSSVFGATTAGVECKTAASSRGKQGRWWSIWGWWSSWSWSLR